MQPSKVHAQLTPKLLKSGRAIRGITAAEIERRNVFEATALAEYLV